MGRLHAHVRPHVRAHVRSPLSGKEGGLSVHDGISFTASTGRVVIKAPGAAPTITTLTSAFTFTGGNQSMYRGPSGLLVQSVTNTPRIEYGPGGDVYGLLMEASRTNLCLQSADLSTTWAVTTATVTANSTTAPDGTATADTLVEDATAASIHQIAQGITFAATTPYTFSAWVKPAGRTWIELRYSAGFGTATSAFFNLSGNGSVGTLLNAPVATITPYANGWYRCTVASTSGAAPAGGQVIFRLANADNGSVYNGDNASGCFVWGCQVEAGAFASSYIPTTTVSVARTADSCIRTLASEFSATAGTVVVAGRATPGQDAALGQFVYAFDDNTTTNRLGLFRPAASDAARGSFLTAGVVQAAIDGTFVNSTNYKSGLAWTANDFAHSFNGGAVVTDAAGTIATVTQLDFGACAASNQNYGHIRTFDYYPQRLPNEFLTARSV